MIGSAAGMNVTVSSRDVAVSTLAWVVGRGGVARTSREQLHQVVRLPTHGRARGDLGLLDEGFVDVQQVRHLGDRQPGVCPQHQDRTLCGAGSAPTARQRSWACSTVDRAPPSRRCGPAPLGCRPRVGAVRTTRRSTSSGPVVRETAAATRRSAAAGSPASRWAVRSHSVVVGTVVGDTVPSLPEPDRAPGRMNGWTSPSTTRASGTTCAG